MNITRAGPAEVLVSNQGLGGNVGVRITPLGIEDVNFGGAVSIKKGANFREILGATINAAGTQITFYSNTQTVTVNTTSATPTPPPPAPTPPFFPPAPTPPFFPPAPTPTPTAPTPTPTTPPPTVGGCLDIETVMHMYDGTTKLLKDIEVGDVLKGWYIPGMIDEDIPGWEDWTESIEVEGMIKPVKVTFTKYDSYHEYYIINNDIKITKRHSLLINKLGTDV